MARQALEIQVIDPATGNAIQNAVVAVKTRPAAAAGTVYAGETGGTLHAQSPNPVTNAQGFVPDAFVERGAYFLDVTPPAQGTTRFWWDATPGGDLTIDSAWLANASIIEAKLADGAVTAVKLAALEAWQVPVFQNGWVNYDANDTVQYRKDDRGRVQMRGLAKNGTVGAVMFTLPAAYRPPSLRNHHFPSVSNGAFGDVLVNSAGSVILAIGSNAYVDLSSVQFYVV